MQVKKSIEDFFSSSFLILTITLLYLPKNFLAKKIKRTSFNKMIRFILVPETGLEPVRSCGPRDFKSLASAYSATSAILEAPPRFELGIKVLQTSALPLGYIAIFILVTPRGFEPLLPP